MILIGKSFSCVSALQKSLTLHHDHDRGKLGSELQPNTALNQQEVCHTAPPSETLADWPHRMTMLQVTSSQI